MDLERGWTLQGNSLVSWWFNRGCAVATQKRGVPNSLSRLGEGGGRIAFVRMSITCSLAELVSLKLPQLAKEDPITLLHAFGVSLILGRLAAERLRQREQPLQPGHFVSCRSAGRYSAREPLA